jgi:hypothetical protein
MATGPEHYSEAEQLVQLAFASKATTYEGTNPEADRLIAAAQVHATLAAAAATAMAAYDSAGMQRKAFAEWNQAAGRTAHAG